MLKKSAAARKTRLFFCYAASFLFLAVVPVFVAAAPLVTHQATKPVDVSHLIDQLGSSDYSTREAATRELQARGDAAVDSLLQAASQKDDLEVALRARWLLEGIPLIQPTDSAQVAELLNGFTHRSAKERLQVLTQLIRLEENAGVEPLARLTRVSPSAGIGQLAAAVLVQEWQPNDPHWPSLAGPILAGIAESQRPTARVLRELIGFSQAVADPAAQPTDKLPALNKLKEAVNSVLAETDSASDSELTHLPEISDSALRLSREITPWSLLKCLAHAASQAGQEKQSIVVAKQLFDRGSPGEAGADNATANLLFWAADIGLPAILDHLPKNLVHGSNAQPLTLYAAAWCERCRGNHQRATVLAAQAHTLAADNGATQLVLATRLRYWGIFDWTEQEFARVLSNEKFRHHTRVQLSVLWIEFLNDQEHFTAAADATQALLASGPAQAATLKAIKYLGYSPEALAARGHYFSSRAAHAAGDILTERQALETALATFDAELDSLIAFYRLPDLTPEDRAWIRTQITKAASSLQQRITAEPDNPNPLNEYAWLVSNTEGDFNQATRYSKRSLELAFDSASYLDTLAHCYAANGEPIEAIRCQLVARRHEPGSLTIEKNLQKFLSLTDQP